MCDHNLRESNPPPLDWKSTELRTAPYETHTHTPGPGPGKHCHYGHVSPRGADNMENDARRQKVGSLPRDQGPCSIGTTREQSPAAMDLESTSRAAASATGPTVGLAA